MASIAEALAEHPLYLILDIKTLDAKGLEADQVMKVALRAGVRAFQFRAKSTDESIEIQARTCASLAATEAAFLAINDDVDLAESLNTPVHLGQEDMLALDRDLDIPYGLSTRTEAEILSAQDMSRLPEYLGFGSCFPSSTKRNTIPQNRKTILLAYEQAKVPLVYIGGIKLDNVKQLPYREQVGFAIIADLYRYGNEYEDIEYYCYQFKQKVFG